MNSKLNGLQESILYDNREKIFQIRHFFVKLKFYCRDFIRCVKCFIELKSDNGLNKTEALWIILHEIFFGGCMKCSILCKYFSDVLMLAAHHDTHLTSYKG